MSVTDYASTAGGNATGLFPENMPRSAVNDGLRVMQADIRSYINNLPFVDIGTGDGPATYAFVSTTSFSVQNVDVTALYAINSRLRISSVAIGSVEATVTSVAFNAPSTLIEVEVDGGVALVNEALSVELSFLDGLAPNAVPNPLIVSGDNISKPLLEAFINASPTAGSFLGELLFTALDPGSAKNTYAAIRPIIDVTTAGNEDVRLILNTVQNGTLRESFIAGNGIADAIAASDGSEAGPFIRTVRRSASPAAGDLIGTYDAVGRNSSGVNTTYSRLQTRINNPANGSEEGAIRLFVLTNGTLDQIVDFSDIGVEFKRRIDVEVSDEDPVQITRNGTTGVLTRFLRNGALVGSISVNASGVVSYNTFTGSHWSEFANIDEADPPEGTLVSAAEGWFHQEKGLPLVEITKSAGCKRIYGVFSDRDNKDGHINVFSLGTAPSVRCTGPVEAGDLLTSSEIPGVARRQADDIVRSSTLGKATTTDIRDTERLVAATIMAG